MTRFDLASLVDLSPFHFARAFKNTAWVPPHRYQVLIRIEQAKGLLRKSGISIMGVGILVGHESQSSFARSFKRQVGMSPLQFRAIGEAER